MPSFFISWLARFREIWQRVILQFCTTTPSPMFPFPTNSYIAGMFSFTFSDALLQIRKTIAADASSSFQTLTMHNFV